MIRTSAFVIALTMSAALAAQSQNPPTQSPRTPSNPPTGSSPASKEPSSKSTLKAADSSFLNKAAQDGQAEIEMASLAQSKSQNESVKALASKIKSDHEQAASELKSLAGQKQVTLSAGTSASHHGASERLDKATGAAFDRAWVDMMVSDHKSAISAFTNASKSADADVKAFADKTLPALKDHLQRAQDLQNQLKAAGTQKPAASPSSPAYPPSKPTTPAPPSSPR